MCLHKFQKMESRFTEVSSDASANGISITFADGDDVYSIFHEPFTSCFSRPDPPSVLVYLCLEHYNDPVRFGEMKPVGRRKEHIATPEQSLALVVQVADDLRRYGRVLLATYGEKTSKRCAQFVAAPAAKKEGQTSYQRLVTLTVCEGFAKTPHFKDFVQFGDF